MLRGYLEMIVLDEQAFDQEPDHRHQERREVVEGLAVFDLEQGEAGRDDEHAADNGKLIDQGAFKQCRAHQQFGQQIKSPLPAEEYGGGEDDADAIGGGKDHRGDQVQRGVRKQEGIVARRRAQNGPDNGESAYTEKQAGRDQAAGQAFSAPFGDAGLGTPVQIQGRAQDAAQRQAQDKEHRKFALGHILDEGIEAQRHRGEAHRVVQHLLVPVT